MTLTIRCYGCGKVFDVLVPSKESQDYPCPECGKIEVFDLGAWEKKAIAWNKKMLGRPRGGL